MSFPMLTYHVEYRTYCPGCGRRRKMKMRYLWDNKLRLGIKQYRCKCGRRDFITRRIPPEGFKIVVEYMKIANN